MRYWYAYTGRSLLLGHGRTIRQVISQPRPLERLLALAEEQYREFASRRSLRVPAETFIATLLAPLAMRELDTTHSTPTAFSSVRQIMALFADLDAEQVAVNLFNGRVASTYTEDSPEKLAERIAQGFSDGELLFLPRDTDRLHMPETLNKLPGMVVYLLARGQAEQKAFASYLRRGTPPVVANADSAAMALLRPMLMTTWERQLRLQREILGKEAHAS